MANPRQLSETEKEEVMKRHGHVCFATGHPIPENEKVEFHHIVPYSLDGPTTIDNIAPVCKDHHRQIKLLSLTEFRDHLEMTEFFKQEKRLDDVLDLKIGQHGKAVNLTRDDGKATITYFDGRVDHLPLYRDPATGWDFIHSFIPCTSIQNDSELQPRAIEVERLWELYQHLQKNPQLAASVARFDANKIFLFDGQHKAAAQVWHGRKSVECKIYLNADARRLKETNLIAHEQLRQMPFYTTTLIRKYGDLFGEDWELYEKLTAPKARRDSSIF